MLEGVSMKKARLFLGPRSRPAEALSLRSLSLIPP